MSELQFNFLMIVVLGSALIVIKAIKKYKKDQAYFKKLKEDQEQYHWESFDEPLSIHISKLEEALKLVEAENIHIGERYYVLNKVLQKLIDESKVND